jgi:hypothetical protein
MLLLGLGTRAFADLSALAPARGEAPFDAAT